MNIEMNSNKLNQAGKSFNQAFFTSGNLNPTYRPQNLVLINGVSAREGEKQFVSSLIGNSILQPKDGKKNKVLVSKTY
jgi:hypothetical protein